MKKYIELDWPECQLFMENYRNNLYFDPIKNVWFIEESIYNKVLKLNEKNIL